MIYDEIIYSDIDDQEMEVTMIQIFDDFTEHFGCEHFVFAFEDKDKTGLFSRKPHYHFFFRSMAKQDTMRRYLTKLGFGGALASLSDIRTNKKHTEQGCIYYTLKHQQVVFTDLSDDLLNEYLSISREYNTNIAPTKNIVVDLLDTVCEKLLQSPKEIDRRQIMYEIRYQYDFINFGKKWDQRYCIPNGSQLLKMIQYVEEKTVPNYIDSWFEDNKALLHESKKRLSQTKNLSAQDIIEVKEALQTESDSDSSDSDDFFVFGKNKKLLKNSQT